MTRLGFAPASAHPDHSPVAVAREMAGRRVSRAAFLAAIDAAGKEMVRTWRKGSQPLPTVYRAVREWRREAMEEFDRQGEARRG